MNTDIHLVDTNMALMGGLCWSVSAGCGISRKHFAPEEGEPKV